MWATILSREISQSFYPPPQSTTRCLCRYILYQGIYILRICIGLKYKTDGGPNHRSPLLSSSSPSGFPGIFCIGAIVNRFGIKRVPPLSFVLCWRCCRALPARRVTVWAGARILAGDSLRPLWLASRVARALVAGHPVRRQLGEGVIFHFDNFLLSFTLFSFGLFFSLRAFSSSFTILHGIIYFYGVCSMHGWMAASSIAVRVCS